MWNIDPCIRYGKAIVTHTVSHSGVPYETSLGHHHHLSLIITAILILAVRLCQQNVTSIVNYLRVYKRPYFLINVCMAGHRVQAIQDIKMLCSLLERNPVLLQDHKAQLHTLLGEFPDQYTHPSMSLVEFFSPIKHLFWNQSRYKCEN